MTFEMGSTVSLDVPPDGRPGFWMFSPHTCRHCQRIVLHDGPDIQLPHTEAEAALALRDGCPFFVNYADVQTQTGGTSPSARLYIRAGGNRLQMGGRNSHFGHYNTLFKLPGQPAPAWAKPLALPKLVPAKTDFAWARRAIAECRETHGGACAEAPAFRPRRLLHVEHDPVDQVRLVETAEELDEDETVVWSTLSYVWGGPQKLRTTTDTLRRHRVGIHVEDMPQTLRDAVAVCRGLGIAYLWVDSLCIVQDDPDELVAELADMYRIYASALVCIAANTAASATEGFLGLRAKRYEQPYQQPLLVPYEGERDGDAGAGVTQGAAVARRTPHHHRARGAALLSVTHLPLHTGYTTAGEMPLLTRAWGLQEAILSTRVVGYGPVAAAFTCRRAPGHMLTRLAADPCTAWYAIVQRYSARMLTEESDKFVAIAALVDRYQSTVADCGSGACTYVAGLWKEHLPYCLAWWPAHQAAPHRRPAAYRAPSWSWACLDGAVSWETPRGQGYLRGGEGVRDAPRVEVVHVATASPHAAFSAVLPGAFITLRGLTSPWAVERRKDPRAPIVYWDVERYYRDEYAGARLSLLLLLAMDSLTQQGTTTAIGLVLLEDAESGSYKRVGYYLLMEKDWEEAKARSWVEKSITIT